MAKNLYIISGCNGAGKTTASYTVLPEILVGKPFGKGRQMDETGTRMTEKGGRKEEKRVQMVVFE